MTVRGWAVLATAAVALGGLAGCGTTPSTGQAAGAAPSASNALGQAPPTTAPAAKPTTAKPKPPKGLTCPQVRNAQLGSSTVKYQGYPDYLPLADGIWSGEDGNTVTMKVCAVGDLDGDGGADALAAVELTSGGTGQFWTLAFWHDANGTPVFTALKDLDDRTPVESIAISAGKATVVWDNRGPTDPMAVLTIRRTSTFKVSGATLTETNHVDQPYTP